MREISGIDPPPGSSHRGGHAGGGLRRVRDHPAARPRLRGPVPGLLAAFMTAADAAVDGREAITAAPALPRPGGSEAAPDVTGASSHVEEIAGDLAALGEAPARLLVAGGRRCHAGDQVACTDAAVAAGRICQLMAPDGDDPYLGEFLRPARAHIAAARYGADLPVPAKRGVIAELDRLVATMARYLDDVALPPDFTPASTADPEARAALDARLAVRRAASSLRPAAVAVRDATADTAHPAAGHLSSANGYLAAGRDLLQTHFTSGPAGRPIGSSHWATVITSRPVTAALLAELAACSCQLAAWTAQLSRTGSLYSGLPADASKGLRTASRWLRIAGTSVQAAHLQQPPAAAGQKLLAAIPPGIPPSRQPPGNTESVPDLCAGITVTAERLRCAARAFAGPARWSPAANSLSWRRDALASAIAAHASELILRGLAERAPILGAGSAVQAQLADAADAISQVWPAWRAIAHHWDTITTGIHHSRDIPPVAAELEDLVVRTGRSPTPTRAGHPPAPTPARPATRQASPPTPANSRSCSRPFTTPLMPSAASRPSTPTPSATSLTVACSTCPPACFPRTTTSRAATRPSRRRWPMT